MRILPSIVNALIDTTQLWKVECAECREANVFESERAAWRWAIDHTHEVDIERIS